MTVLERRGGSMIGLDIGSSAVRAVALSRTRKGLSLDRFGQVGLPVGAVVDGEVVDSGAVVTALRRLWAEAGFRSRTVVLALSGQRVIVRQADVLTMSESEFRSALSFQAMDLIPIPVDDAQLDFVVLPGRTGTPKPSDRMEIVLAAAHRRLVQGHLSVLREASLHAIAIDPAPMAAARAAASSIADDLPAAVVDVGADLTVVTVVEAGHVRFSRILNAGGSDITNRLAERRCIGRPEAERMKRDQSPVRPAGALLVDDLDILVDEIESSLAFFATQLTGAPIGEVLVTGGASRDPELIAQLARRTPGTLRLLDPLDRIDCEEVGLDDDARSGAASTCLVALGAAEWAWSAAGARLTLLPREVAAAAKLRRTVVATAAGLIVVAGGLTVASLARSHQVTAAKAQLNVTVAQNDLAQQQVAGLSSVVTTTQAISGRLEALNVVSQGDVAWSRLLSEITSAMPAHTVLTALSFSGPGAASGGGPSSSSSLSSSGTATAATEGGSGPLGSVTMSVTGIGTEEQVAVWLRAFRHVRGLEYVWVPAATTGSGKVTFSSSGGITDQAPLVRRLADAGSPS